MMFRAFPSSSEIGAVNQAIESSAPRASTNVVSNSIGRWFGAPASKRARISSRSAGPEKMSQKYL